MLSLSKQDQTTHVLLT